MADELDAATRHDWQSATLTSTENPEAVKEANRQLLLGIVEVLIAEGAPGERDLLARATELRAELSGSTLTRGRQAADPTATEDDSAMAGMARATRASVLSQVRALAIDPNASPHDRRVLWSWIAPHLREWLTSVAERALPTPQVTQVGSRKELVATRDGVLDDAMLNLARADIVEDYAIGPMQRYSWVLVMVAAIALLGGVVAYGVTRVNAWWWLVAASGVALAVGGTLRSRYRRQLGYRRQALDRLTEDVVNALARSERADKAALREHEETTQAARRALSLLPD